MKSSLLFTQKMICFLTFKIYFHHYLQNQESSLLFTQKLTCFFMFKITSIITCKTKKLVCFLPKKWLAFSCSEFTSIIPCKIKKLVCFLHKKWLAFHFYDLWPLSIEIGKLFAFNPESDLFFIYMILKKLKRETLTCF